MYSATDRRDQTFTLSGLEIEGFGNALYGHAGAGLFANGLVVEPTTQPGFAHFRVRNCGVAIVFDPADGKPALVDGLSLRCEVDIVGVDSFLQTESRSNIEGGGFVIFSDRTVGAHSISSCIPVRRGIISRESRFILPNLLITISAWTWLRRSDRQLGPHL